MSLAHVYGNVQSNAQLQNAPQFIKTHVALGSGTLLSKIEGLHNNTKSGVTLIRYFRLNVCRNMNIMLLMEKKNFKDFTLHKRTNTLLRMYFFLHYSKFLNGS